MITILVKFIGFIFNKIKKKEGNLKVLGKWSNLACILQVIVLLFLAAVISMASNYAWGITYSWMFAVIGIIAIVMIGLICYGFLKITKNLSSKKRKFFNYTILLSMLITVVNILYWNLFMFWAL